MSSTNQQYHDQINRTLLEQGFLAYALNVQTSPTAVNEGLSWQGYITSFIISVPQAAANPVYLGNNNVTTASGIELTAGNHTFAINFNRQLYEVQFPLLDIASVLGCKKVQPEGIPFLVFLPNNWFLIAGAVTDVRIMLFPAPYV